MVLFIWEVWKIPRIIVKTGYIKGKVHKEYYVQYIATREGVEKYKSDHGDKPATTKQKELISQLMKDYPEAEKMQVNWFPLLLTATSMILQTKKIMLIIFPIDHVLKSWENMGCLVIMAMKFI